MKIIINSIVYFYKNKKQKNKNMNICISVNPQNSIIFIISRVITEYNVTPCILVGRRQKQNDNVVSGVFRRAV